MPRTVREHRSGIQGDPNEQLIIHGMEFSEESGEPLYYEVYDPGNELVQLHFAACHGEGCAEQGGEAFTGVTNEALLAIVLDRLACLSAGPMASDEVDDAMSNIEKALLCLKSRTRDRAERGALGQDIP